MPRKIQPSYTPFPRHLVACMGDSHTDNKTLGVLASEFYPSVFSGLLNEAGCLTRPGSLGVSGQTTAHMVYRQAGILAQGVPSLFVLYAGANDRAYDSTVKAAPAPTTTSFTLTDAGKGAGYAVGATTRIAGGARVITAVTGDLIGVETGALPVAGQSVVIDTQANLTAIAAYAAAAMAEDPSAAKVVIVGQHYLNWSSGGDTHASPLAAGVTLRALQSAAATAAGAAYCDWWALMDARIQAGVDIQGSFTAHVLDANTHLSAYGERLGALALKATTEAQTGWIAALSA